LITVIMIYSIMSWRPRFHFYLPEIKPYIKFGLNVAGASSLRYIYSKSDRFFGGRILGPHILGYYSLALSLAVIPIDKLVTLINTIAFPVFSRYQNKKQDFNNLYLILVRMISFIVFPIYMGGFFLADQLIPAALGHKWNSAITPFKILCLAQIIVAVTTSNDIANNAQGRPHWPLRISFIYATFLPFSFYVASKYGLNFLAAPWISVFPLINVIYSYFTLRQLGVKIIDYIKTILHPILATLTMLFFLIMLREFYFTAFSHLAPSINYYLVCSIMSGMIIYILYILIFQRQILLSFLSSARS